MDCFLVHGRPIVARPEDRATLESDLSAVAGGRTDGQGQIALPFLLSFLPSGGPVSDKLQGSGGSAPGWA